MITCFSLPNYYSDSWSVLFSVLLCYFITYLTFAKAMLVSVRGNLPASFGRMSTSPYTFVIYIYSSVSLFHKILQSIVQYVTLFVVLMLWEITELSK